jgi:flotillin
MIITVLGWATADPLLALSVEGVAGTAAGIGFGTLVTLFMIRNFLYICRPNQVLIFSGSKAGPIMVMPHGVPGQAPDSAGGKGRKWRVPLVETVESMDLRTMSIDIVVHNAYSKGNIPLKIHAIANVKAHTNPLLLRNAVERFLGREQNEIRIVAQQTLEGAVREVLALLTPEQVNEDRLTFAEALVKSVRDDFDKLGLELDTLKIQNVSDDKGYLDALGRPRIADVLRQAEQAEADAMQKTEEAEAGARQRSEVARANAQADVLTKRNELAKLKAELAGEADAVKREAEAAAKTARAQAERQLQEVRAVLEKRRLQADVIIPAEFQRQAAALRAKGDAAPTIEDGKAIVEVLDATAEAWKAMGPQAREIYVIQHLEEIVAGVVEKLRNVQVDEVHVLDPGDGSGLASYAAAYPQAVARVLSALGETIGVDVPRVLAEQPTRRGV